MSGGDEALGGEEGRREMTEEGERLFRANLPPKPVGELADWLDTDEGREWFFRPVACFAVDGTPIRAALDPGRIASCTMSADAIKAVSLGGYRGSRHAK